MLIFYLVDSKRPVKTKTKNIQLLRLLIAFQWRVDKQNYSLNKKKKIKFGDTSFTQNILHKDGQSNCQQLLLKAGNENRRTHL